MSSHTDAAPGCEKEHGRLLCCFDGTGNQFGGDTSDTNIVKLYQKFDCDAAKQFHYYQPGIGTYVAGAESINTGLWGKIQRWWTQTVDLGLGISFDQHVMSGYRFIMRFHEEDDKIFMFGFSRGAFTARFLARMISTVGLLSKGNEEMVPFAYRTYQEYSMGTGRFKTVDEAEKYMASFKTTFCRSKAKVHFLGLFDTVNSVGYFDNPFSKQKYLPSVVETATHVRHAVAIDERRCKFKPALLQQDIRKAIKRDTDDDIKELFFPGNHGDVGGGWLAPGNKDVSEADDPVQLSDLALKWMIDELEALSLEDKIIWNDHKTTFTKNYDRKFHLAERAPMHDILKFGGGASRIATFMWRILEWLPFKRLELIDGVWKPMFFPPNMGGTRDIPNGAVYHSSVKARWDACKDYRPENDGFKVEDLR